MKLRDQKELLPTIHGLTTVDAQQPIRTDKDRLIHPQRYDRDVQLPTVLHLNQKELARRWRMSPRTLERWRWLHQGPSYLKIGGKVIYKLTEVEAFEAARSAFQNGLVSLGNSGATLLVTDHLMPGMSGTDLARVLQSRRPTAKVLVVSGYAEAEGAASLAALD